MLHSHMLHSRTNVLNTNTEITKKLDALIWLISQGICAQDVLGDVLDISQSFTTTVGSTTVLAASTTLALWASFIVWKGLYTISTISLMVKSWASNSHTYAPWIFVYLLTSTFLIYVAEKVKDGPVGPILVSNFERGDSGSGASPWGVSLSPLPLLDWMVAEEPQFNPPSCTKQDYSQSRQPHSA